VQVDPDVESVLAPFKKVWAAAQGRNPPKGFVAL
jgi:hypothetical protein